MLSFSISYWDLIKFHYLADTTERGDREWKQAQRQRDFTYNSIILQDFHNLTQMIRIWNMWYEGTMNAANLMCRLNPNAMGFTKIRTCVKVELSKGPIPVKPLAQAFIKRKDLCQFFFPWYSTDIKEFLKNPRYFKKWNSHHKMSLP